MDLTNNEPMDIGIGVEPCVGKEPEGGEAQCANVMLDRDLEIGIKYTPFSFL